MGRKGEWRATWSQAALHLGTFYWGHCLASSRWDHPKKPSGSHGEENGAQPGLLKGLGNAPIPVCFGEGKLWVGWRVQGGGWLEGWKEAREASPMEEGAGAAMLMWGKGTAFDCTRAHTMCELGTSICLLRLHLCFPRGHDSGYRSAGEADRLDSGYVFFHICYLIPFEKTNPQLSD